MNCEDHSMFWLSAYEILFTGLFTFLIDIDNLKTTKKPTLTTVSRVSLPSTSPPRPLKKVAVYKFLEPV